MRPSNPRTFTDGQARARAFALGLPLEAGRSARECAVTLCGAELMVHDIVGTAGALSKRQLFAKLRGRCGRTTALQAVDAGRRTGWLAVRPGPRRAHALQLLCCGSVPEKPVAVEVVDQPLGPRRPLDAYDALRLGMLIVVLRRLLADRPQAVLQAYSRGWRSAGAPRRAWEHEGEVWQELADVDEGLLQPILAFLEEAEFLRAEADCLLVDPMLRERLREYGHAFCDPCGQVHQLGRRT